MFCIYFGWCLSSAIIPNQLLKQTCLTRGYNISDCTNMVENKDAASEIEEIVQPEVAFIMMVTSLLNATVPAVLSLFLGPWTDKVGRKKVLCAVNFGHSIGLIFLTLISVASDNNVMISPWAYILPQIPVILTGGWPALGITVGCYVTDLADESSRAIRFMIVEISVYGGIVLGMASSSFVLKATSPSIMFMMSAAAVTAAAVYTVVYVDETLKGVQEASTYEQLFELFSLFSFIDMIKTCIKPRRYKVRKILWFLICVQTFNAISSHDKRNLFYLFTREKFQWTLKEASLFDSGSLVISIVGSIIGLAIMKKKLGFSDISIAIIGTVSMFGDSVIKAFAQSPISLYVAALTCLLHMVVSPQNEIGKVYSMTSSLEALAGLFSAPLYTFIYTETFTYFTGAFFLITAFFCFINLFLISGIQKMKRLSRDLDSSDDLY